MSKNTENLFSFGRHMPEPFRSIASTRINGVQSIYGEGNKATLCPSVAKAVQAYCACQNGSGYGAVGTQDNKCIAEYKSSVSADAYHLVVYDTSTGEPQASVYSTTDQNMELYRLDKVNRDGAALLFAMMPVFIEDEEFRQQLHIYSEQAMLGFTDMTVTTNSMAILCDNVYRRIKDNSCPAHVEFNIEASGRLQQIPRAQLDAGKYTPKSVIAGEFTIFANTGASEDIEAALPIIEQEEFVGKFAFGARTLSALEQSLIPKLPDWYVIPKEVLDICKHAAATTGRPTQMRNFLLRGPAGTGKTMGAEAIAAGLNLPYMKFTCSANTEIYDFIGQIFPDSENASTGDVTLDKELQQLKAMGGMNYANIAKVMGLPPLDDMDYDPSGVYKKLTGTEKGDATTQECMELVLEKVTRKVGALSKRVDPKKDGGQRFSYIETDFIKALKNGYVIEIQEPTVIMQPGVLVGLNSLLEQRGSITLPTGEIIKRHPDAVVVVTTNIAYEGCRGVNQSIIDRMSLVRDVELPSSKVMQQRAMSVTGETDSYKVTRMVNVVNSMAEYCRKNSITDGTVGMRSLIDWIVSANVTGDVYESALYTVISKATAVEEDREALITSVLEPEFKPASRKTEE